MNSLSTVLSNISIGVTATVQPANISATLQHGLIKAGGKMTTELMIAASQPRETAISLDRAESAMQWLRQLKSSRKFVAKHGWKSDMTGMETTYHSSYTLPEGMTRDSVVRGLIELIKPCSTTVTKYFVTLQAFKPFFEADPKNPDTDRNDMVYEMLYRDIKDMPEVAVVLTLDDLRKGPGKWFPLDEILPAVSEYRDIIYNALDFFQGEK